MDVRCPQCRTDYVFDEARVGPSGVSVKCAACGHVFRVFKPGDQPQPRLWQVRQSDGTRVEFKELTTLQKWIVEGRIRRDHEISRDGETWKPLGEIKELDPFFTVVERAERAEAAARPASPPPPPPPRIQSSIPSLQSHIYSPAELEPIRREAGLREPSSGSQELVPPDLPIPISGVSSAARPSEPPLSVAWAAVGVALAFALGGGIYLLTQHPETSDRWLRRLGWSEPTTEGAPGADSGAPRAEAEAETEAEAEEADVAAASAPAPTETTATTPPDPGAADRDQRATLQRPPTRESLTLEGAGLLDEGQLAEALDSFGRASQLEPEHPEPHTGKGRVYLQMGRPDLAVTSFRRALSLNPRFLPARFGLGKALLATGETEAGRNELNRFLDEAPAQNPSRPEAEALLGGT
jgi:predicted Zn finger-like uncharacterized protein